MMSHTHAGHAHSNVPSHSHSSGCSSKGHLRLQLSVLLRQLQQHGVVKELGDADILAHALAAACLDAKLAREPRHRCRFQRAQHDGAVKRVAWYNSPVIKQALAEGLTLCVAREWS